MGKGEQGVVALLGVARGLLGVQSGKQELARSTSREPPHSSSLNSTMKTKQRLQKSP
jgi:hypothetical protein